MKNKKVQRLIQGLCGTLMVLSKNEDIKNGQSQIAGHCPFLLYCICTYCFCGGSSRNFNAEAAFRRCSSPTDA